MLRIASCLDIVPHQDISGMDLVPFSREEEGTLARANLQVQWDPTEYLPPPSPEDGTRYSFRNIVFSSFYNIRGQTEPKNPAIGGCSTPDLANPEATTGCKAKPQTHVPSKCIIIFITFYHYMQVCAKDNATVKVEWIHVDIKHKTVTRTFCSRLGSHCTDQQRQEGITDYANETLGEL
jgi:hypothetical protein